MKKISILFAVIASLFLYSCNQGETQNTENATDSEKLDKSCYTAIFEKDTAYLKIQTDPSGRITGDFTINYGELKPNTLEKGSNVGTVEGKFSGDTLFVDYTHTSGSINNRGYINPLAFLKVGDNLVLGVGEIENHTGRSFFVKDKPIDFEIARFIFEPVDCEE